MQSVVSANPFRCRMWALHDRLEPHVTEASCQEEIESFSRHGQFVPVLGRAVRCDPDYDIELIYGSRRLFVARHINKPLAVELRDISDREAIVAMDIENRQRTDISPYERGLSYARWLRRGHFQSQDDIARALQISKSQVSRLLKMAKLPSVVVDAFDSPLHICEGWGLELAEALEDPLRRQVTIQKARALGAITPRLPAREVYQQFLGAKVRGRKIKAKTHDEVINGCDGAPLFRIRYQTDSVAVVLPMKDLSAQSLDSIQRAISNILQHTATQAVETGPELVPSDRASPDTRIRLVKSEPKSAHQGSSKSPSLRTLPIAVPL